jgi:Holliday junction resolvasome RuvABC endonuclease subunit
LADDVTRIHIAGFDVSLARTGWATVRIEHDRPPVIDHGVIPSNPVGGTTADYYPLTLARIRRIAGRIVGTVRREREVGDPLIVAMEGPALGVARDAAGQADARAGLRWLVYHLLEKEADAFVIIPPSNLKQYLTGKGGGPDADKVAIVAAAQRAYPDRWITDDNEAEALGLAAMVARQINAPIEASVQRCHPFALNAVHWPVWIRR